MSRRQSRFGSNIQVCPSWTAITQAFDQLPKLALRRDENGETYREGWVYRGHKSQIYRLKPSIEREDFGEWAGTEYKILREFQSKAPMHFESSQLPSPDCKLRWLAIMQHYGAPTRLLDFTYSPYVALYFALRHRRKAPGRYAEVWGIDAIKVQRRAEKMLLNADKEVRKEQGLPTELTVASSMLENMSSALQRAQEEDEYWETAMRIALNPCGIRREQFNQSGLIIVASPPVQNLRLSSQQGAFLFNGAEALSFEESLAKMMRGCGDQWYKRFRVPDEKLHEIEEQLFQLNIHDLSLFPDAEGLAGYVRQRVRLHW